MARVATRRALLSRPAVAAAGNWWEIDGETCVAAYQPIGAASLAASYTNLANPGTYDAAPGVAPTFAAATGWTFNGTDQYLTTGVTPTQSASLVVRMASVVYSGDRYGWGSWDSGSSARFAPLFRESTSLAYTWGSTLSWTGSKPTSGVVAMASNLMYINGSLSATVSSTFTDGNAVPITLGCRNLGGIPASHMAFAMQAVAIYSTTLDATQVAALTTRMQGLA